MGSKTSFSEQQAPEIIRNNFALKNCCVTCDTFIYRLY